MDEAMKNPHCEPDPQAPQALEDDLRALFGQPAEVPPQIDDAIRAMARSHLSRKPRFSRHFRWAAAAAAAAAVLLVAFTAFLFERESPARAPEAAAKAAPALAPRPSSLASSPRPSPLVPRPPLEGDINGDGRVDILDAFALARQIELANALKPEWDFNHDGLVDRKDADAIAQTAVRLDTHPPTGRKPAGG